MCGFSSSIDPGEDEEQYVTAMVTVIQEIGVKREFTDTEIAEAQNKDRRMRSARNSMKRWAVRNVPAVLG